MGNSEVKDNIEYYIMCNATKENLTICTEQKSGDYQHMFINTILTPKSSMLLYGNVVAIIDSTGNMIQKGVKFVEHKKYAHTVKDADRSRIWTIVYKDGDKMD